VLVQALPTDARPFSLPEEERKTRALQNRGVRRGHHENSRHGCRHGCLLENRDRDCHHDHDHHPSIYLCYRYLVLVRAFIYIIL
jgi:hypothetical protein